jgi:membrane-associated protease RseP (regulator of RpoE activity)
MEHKDRTVTVAIITGVIALLLGCCLGALFGVMGGIFIGHQAAGRPAERIMPYAPELPTLPELPGRQGAVVQEVVTGSPAEDAGMAIGDIITAVDGTPIDANHRLADVVGQYQPGDRVKLTILRAGATKSITATLGENPQDSTRPYLGVRYADVPDQPDNAAPSD